MPYTLSQNPMRRLKTSGACGRIVTDCQERTHGVTRFAVNVRCSHACQEAGRRVDGAWGVPGWATTVAVSRELTLLPPTGADDGGDGLASVTVVFAQPYTRGHPADIPRHRRPGPAPQSDPESDHHAGWGWLLAAVGFGCCQQHCPALDPARRVRQHDQTRPGSHPPRPGHRLPLVGLRHDAPTRISDQSVRRDV